MSFKKSLFFILIFLGLHLRTDAQATCPPNIDFEDGTTDIWLYYIGSCCPIFTPTSTPPLPSRHALTSGAGLDYYGGFPIVSPGGGSYSMKLGNDTGGSRAEKARYYVDVPTGVTNYCLIYRYAVVIEDPNPEHDTADQPRFTVSAYDSATTTAVPCAAYSYVATSTLPGFVYSTVPSNILSNGLDVIYKGWATASINLSGLGGTTVAIDFATGDCALGGHFGYGYFDMSCGLFAISGVACDDSDTVVTLSAPDGFEFYRWYDSATFTISYGDSQTITTAIPPGPATYAVILTPYPGYGCPDTLYTRVAPSHLELHPTNDTLICSAADITLTAGATSLSLPLSYTWSPPTGLSCTTCADPVASPTVTTTYYVNVTCPAGCSKTDSIVVSVHPFSVDITTVDDTCFGYNNGSATVSVTSGSSPYSYSWTTTPVQTTATATGLYAGTYSVTATDAFGCSLTKPATINDGPVTVLIVVGTTNPTTCQGTDGTITLGGLVPGETFIVKYVFDSVTYTQTLVASGTGTVVVTGLAQGVYTSIGIIPMHCPYNTVGPLVLTDPPLPSIPYVGSNSPVCLSSPLNLSVVGTTGVTFSWRGPGTYASALQYPVIDPVNYSDSGKYVITVMINNCIMKDSTYVIVKPLPIPTATSNSPVCSGDTLVLSGSSANGATAYQWEGPYGYAVHTQNPAIKTIGTGASGTYTLTVTLNGCMSVDTTIVTVNLTPDSPAVTNVEICQYDPAVPLSATGTNLRWYTDATGGTGSTLAPTPSTLQEAIYTWFVSQTSDAGCESPRSRITAVVDYFATPYIDIADSVVCRGSDILFHAKNTGDDMTGIIWGFEQGDSMRDMNPVLHSFDGIGTFTVSATAYYKVCPVKSASRAVTIFASPAVYIGPDTSICPGSNPIVLKDYQNEQKKSARWIWNTGATGPAISVTTPGSYNIKVTIDGCSAYDSVMVSNDCYMDIPNVFTPNGDGINDYFFPRALLTRGLQTFSMDIFNRWGQLIFTTTSTEGRGWDGRFNDTPQPEGVFVYLIKATFRDGQKEQHQGNVTLLR